MPLVEELSEVRRMSKARGSVSSRRESVAFSEGQKRRMSMGYEKFLLPGYESPPLGGGLGGLFLSGIHVNRAGSDLGEVIASAGTLKFTSQMQAVVYKYTESKFFTSFIMLVILVNTAMLVSQTWPIVMVRATWYFSAMDAVFLGLYVMEVVLKLYVWRHLYFKDGWNILDFSIVTFNIVDFLLPLILSNVGGFNGAAIFRLLKIFRAVKAIRALRVLRTIRIVSNLQVIMATLIQSIKSIGAIVTLMTLVLYMFAVVGRGLYSDVDKEHFGTLFECIITLFQLLTLDDWFEIYLGIKEENWTIILYLLLYIISEYFIFLNLFVAVLVDNFQLSLESANEAARERKKNQVDSDDEDDPHQVEAVSEDSMSTELSSEKTKIKSKSLEEHYSGMNYKQRESLRHYLQILASLEYNQMMLSRQQRVLDMMVDICGSKTDD